MLLFAYARYLRNLLLEVIKNSGSSYDFYYDWCSQKPNIKSDDPIYTNNYGIIYNGKNEWLRRNNSTMNQTNNTNNLTENEKKELLSYIEILEKQNL